MWPYTLVLGLLASLFIWSPQEARPGPWVDHSPHKQNFVTVSTVKLHYLDWGGSGQTVIFLAGLGLSPHTFDDLAPRLTNRFRVIGLTRRGLSPSDAPPGGYDNATLVEDIRGVLDALQISRAIFIGHSMAGDEMTAFAGRYPQRTTALIYLDAAYDHSPLSALMAKEPIHNPPTPEELSSFEGSKRWFVRVFGFWSDAIEADARATNLQPDGSMKQEGMPASVNKALFAEMNSYHPDYTKMQAPILAFYALPKNNPSILPDTPAELRAQGQAFWDHDWKPYQRAEMQRLKSAKPGARIVEMEDVNHLCFIRRQDADLVLRESLSFLATRP